MDPNTVPRYPEIIDFLTARGAAEMEHPGGTLLDHLHRTARTLAEWSAETSLVTAGLCHAAYGTAGFPVALVPVERRDELAELIGTSAEQTVYRYGGCDRGFLYPQLGVRQPVEFRDRFTGDTAVLADDELAPFIELTFANELDVFGHNDELLTQHGPGLAALFERCERMASPAAYRAFLASDLPRGTEE
ncbi:DUF6817 domain-containing protein [Actinocrispum wychmicini]|uniref:DUF6817 domain-containing protein n=1 Tax=Actinocrispum wychmicini TaxID=1213861 RepID=A0A4R2JZ20_9PSEU|nr:hypothetical protein [Actinocrispum wychmicini]TCO65861.1 hypothetical protein EV192_1011653 [Actinocrispum wychmicini]